MNNLELPHEVRKKLYETIETLAGLLGEEKSLGLEVTSYGQNRRFEMSWIRGSYLIVDGMEVTFFGGYDYYPRAEEGE